MHLVQHINMIETLKYPQTDIIRLLEFILFVFIYFICFLFIYCLLELIVTELPDLCVHMHSCQAPEPGPWCCSRNSTALLQTQRAHTASPGESGDWVMPTALSPAS